MSPPASTPSLRAYTDGNRLFNAKLAIRFWLALISRPPATESPAARCFPIAAKNSVEIIRRSYLPRLNSQSQRTRHWENLFHVECTVRSGRIVENRDTGKFGDGFFEQFQPLAA